MQETFDSIRQYSHNFIIFYKTNAAKYKETLNINND